MDIIKGILSFLGMSQNISQDINAVSNLYTTDKEKLDAEQKLQETVNKPSLVQLSTNKILASSSSIFNSGWQSLIGWTCGFLVLLYYAPQILICTYVWGLHCIYSNVITPFPMSPDNILNLIWLLFGFGGYSLIKRKL